MAACTQLYLQALQAYATAGRVAEPVVNYFKPGPSPVCAGLCAWFDLHLVGCASCRTCVAPSAQRSHALSCGLWTLTL